MDERHIKALTARLVIIVAVLSLFSIASFLILEMSISGNSHSGALINVSGRQRMFSQRISHLAVNLGSIRDPILWQSTRTRLLKAIKAMEKAHQALLYGNPDLNITGRMSPETKAFYFGPNSYVHWEVKRFLHAAKIIADQTVESPELQNRLHFFLGNEPTELLNNLDQIVSQYLIENDREVARLQGVQVGVLLLTLSLLLLAALWGVHPIFTRIRKDMEERHKHEANLRKLSQAVEASPASVIITDRNGLIQYVNPQFSQTSGFSSEEVLGQKTSILRSEHTSPITHSRLWGTILSGNPWRGVLRNKKKQGEVYWESMHISPIRDMGSGEITHFVAVKEDITERRHNEEALKKAKQQAEQANRAKSEFLSSMSHELRTPMNAVLGFAELLESDPMEPLTESQLDSVREISKAGRYLLTLIDEILDLAKIEAGKVAISLEEVSPKEVLHDCLALIQALTEKRQVELEDGLTGCNVPLIHVDRMRFKQILLNLLSNAVKYNRSGGRVRIEYEIHNKYLRLRITDTGLGIPEAQQHEVFKPFQRLGAEESTVKGTGIGLTITKRLVEQMDGQIDFTSETGKGSIFWVDFPLAQGGAKSQQKAHIDSGAHRIRPFEPTSQAITVLYIEDNPANLLLMQRILKRFSNLTLISAPDAELGLGHAEKRPPDVIFMDINLPGMDGFEAFLQLQATPRLSDIPVVAVSADAMPSSIEKGRAAGFFRYLTKPLAIEEVCEALNDALEKNLLPTNSGEGQS
ncbi:MAG: PAS domain S-box protein [Magnetococcales bacterium]|nr:PAS domain S-box protein [Magnetococcales bacterium]